MSARTPPVPFTREDKLIWLQINIPLNRPPLPCKPLEGYRRSDRRDADLMWAREREKAIEVVCPWAQYRRQWFPTSWGIADGPRLNPPFPHST